MIVIDAKNKKHKELNEEIEKYLNNGYKKIKLINVNGQRYIFAGVKGDYYLEIEGVAGDDLGAFMDGPTIVVKGNCQDAAGNTMNYGKIIIHGDARDVIGYAMRGGCIYVNGDVGYRVGIHMKEYKDKKPLIIVANTAGDFLGEYMAGGVLIVLRMKGNYIGDFIATGIHGGCIYIRGYIDDDRLGYGAKIEEFTDDDVKFLENKLEEFCNIFGYSLDKIISKDFTKIVPISHRPYGKLYTE